jgi:HK97 family phage prohead protease
MFTLEQRKSIAESLGGRETRTYGISDFEMREDVDGTVTFRGIASVTGAPYDMGSYQETIARGAFARTLGQDPDVQLLINHAGLPIARTRRNMELREDGNGLAVEARLNPALPLVQELRLTAGDGLIDQMSFAFRVQSQEWNEDYSDRNITEVNIHRGDVSVVNQGANPATSFNLRSLISRASQEEIAELAELFRSLTVPATSPEVVEVLTEESLSRGLDPDVAMAQLHLLRLKAA